MVWDVTLLFLRTPCLKAVVNFLTSVPDRKNYEVTPRDLRGPWRIQILNSL